MSRSISLTVAFLLTVAGCNLAHGQDAQTNNPAAGPANSSASTGDDLAALQAENAALKKEVAVAKQTIAQLQAALAQAGIKNQADISPAAPPDNSSAAPAAADTGAPSTNATPAGPLRALPLDATNANATAAAPGAEAGPSRSYTVVKGDSLWKIAHKMYPHDTLNGEDKIRDANKDVFNGKFLQPGQVLVIPQ